MVKNKCFRIDLKVGILVNVDTLITNMMLKVSGWTDDSVQLSGILRKINDVEKLNELSV
jgi:hypothetical protein